MKMAIKHENDEFLVITLKHVSSLMVLVNRPRIPKLWLIANEHGHKARKRRVFGHNSQTCIRSDGHCKSPSNPKLMKMSIKHKNGEFLVINLKHVLGLIVALNHPRSPKTMVNSS